MRVVTWNLLKQSLESSGLCYYNVNCDSSLPCCSADRWVGLGQTSSTNVVNFGSLIVYVAFTVWLNRWVNGVRERYWDMHMWYSASLGNGMNLVENDRGRLNYIIMIVIIIINLINRLSLLHLYWYLLVF